MRVPKSSFLLLAAFTGLALAQAQNSDGNRNTPTNTTPQTTIQTSTTAQTTAAQTTAAQTTTAQTTAARTTAAPNPGLPNASTDSVTTTTRSSNGDAATTAAVGGGLPKMPKQYTIPMITPPPNANAPFMQQSKYPEGTIFIAVGGGLALCLLIVMVWRGIVAWSLYRSMSRATTTRHSMIDSKASKGNGSGGFYAAGPGSALSLDHLGSGRLPGLGPNGSLFFSPTSNTIAPNSPGGDRRSTYLPPGFYAAGNRNSAAPSNNSQMRLSRCRGSGISPPGTPLMAPQNRMSGIPVNDSQTSLALPTGRAPSAYLEDLFENHQLPEQGGLGRL